MSIHVFFRQQWLHFLGLILLVLFPNFLQAQLPQTRLYAISPMGGQIGQTFELTLSSGADLEEVSQLLFTHPGISAVPKMHDVKGTQQPVPNTFVVTIAGDVPVGRYEVRAIGFFGISNPRAFDVGTMPEFSEIEPNNTEAQAQAIGFDQTINGKMNAGADVDWFKITGKSGQRILGELYAQRLDSRFDGKIELFDANKRRLAVAHHNVLRDPLLDVTLPADGEYLVKVHDFVFGGGEEFGYRLTFTTGPHLDFVMPPAGVPGTTASYTLYGRNLPGGQPTDLVSQGRPLEKLDVQITVPADATQLESQFPLDSFSTGIDGFSYRFSGPTGSSNAVFLSFADHPVTIEQEPNNDAAHAHPIVVPGEYAGQFQARGDADVFVFDTKAGDTYWIEVLGHRLGYGSDPYLVIDRVVVNDKGEETPQRLATADDDPTNPLPVMFETVSDDAAVKFSAPADGKYRLTLRDRSAVSRGDAALIYRLSIRKEVPDFRVVAVPSAPVASNVKQGQPWSIGLRRGDQVAVHVAVFRRDGFSGPVEILAEGLPPGVICRDISIGTSPSSGLLVFTAAEDAPVWAGTVRLIGKSAVEDSQLVASQAAAQAALKPAYDAVAAAEKALVKPQDELKVANEALVASQNELAAKPDDESLKKKVADAEAKVAAATTTHQTALTALMAAQAKAKAADAAVANAKHSVIASRKVVMHPVRFGTVLYNSQPNIPAPARLSQALELSVIEESAPFELLTDVHRIEANHGRQILIPVKVIRRNGFDNAVTMTFAGQPQNVQVENKPIPKEKGDELFRVFVPPNAPAGTYVMYLEGQQQVSYRKNPAKAELAKAELQAAEKVLAAATEALNSANTARDAAVKLAQEKAEALKKATEAKVSAEKTFADAQSAEKAAEQAVKDAGENAEQKAASEKKLAEAKTATENAKAAVDSAEKTRADEEKAVQEADAAKTKAEADAKQADEKNKGATAVKTEAEQASKKADEATKPQNINFLPTTTPIVLTIKPAPFTLSATPAESGNLKKGGRNEVKVVITRQNGFAGPAIISLPLPPGIAGVKAEPITIPADKTEGVLAIETAGDAPEAALANMVVRATASFEGEAIVDAPVTLKVVP